MKYFFSINSGMWWKVTFFVNKWSNTLMWKKHHKNATRKEGFSIIQADTCWQIKTELSNVSRVIQVVVSATRASITWGCLWVFALRSTSLRYWMSLGYMLFQSISNWNSVLGQVFHQIFTHIAFTPCEEQYFYWCCFVIVIYFIFNKAVVKNIMHSFYMLLLHKVDMFCLLMSFNISNLKYLCICTWHYL